MTTEPSPPSAEILDMSPEVTEYLWQFESSLMSSCHDLATKGADQAADEDREILKTYIRTLEKEHRKMREALEIISTLEEDEPLSVDGLVSQKTLASLTLKP